MIGNQKPDQPHLLYGVFRSSQKNLSVHSLCKLQTYSRQICTIGTSDVDAPTDSPQFGLFFDVTGVNMQKSNLWATMVAQIVTSACRHLNV